jgi:hypothetical protein
MITTLTFTVIKPTLERNRGFNVINEASVNLELLSSAINEVATEAEGSKRTITLSVSDGEYLIDKNSNNIIFTFEPSIDLGVIGRIGDKFLEKGLVFFDFFNNYLDNSLPNSLINVSGNWRVYNNRLEGTNGTAYYFIDKNLNGFYVASNFGSDNNLGQIFVSPVNLSNLVLYLTFDEGSGNIVYDYSGNKNNGTLVNGPTWTDGKFGKAISFDGVNDYVNLPLSLRDQTDPTLNPISIAFWIKSNSLESSHWDEVVIGGWAYHWFVSIPNNIPTAYIYNSSAYLFSVSSGVQLQPGTWTQIVVTYDIDHSISIYVNGVKKNKAYWIGSFTRATTYMRIGGRGSNFINGTIDEVMVFNRSLTDDEVKFLYQEGLKKLQNSGMIQFNSPIKPYIAISNPSGKIYVENLRVGNQNSREIKLIKPFYGLEFDYSFRFSKGNHQIKIENIGFNLTSKRPIIRISES